MLRLDGACEMRVANLRSSETKAVNPTPTGYVPLNFFRPLAAPRLSQYGYRCGGYLVQGLWPLVAWPTTLMAL